MDRPEHFCILPWINQEARTNGDIGVCCVMQETAPGLNLADGHTLKDAWDSEWLANLKQDFLDGKKPDACYNCWNEEEAGMESKRKRELLKFGHHVDNLQHLRPKSMDLKLGSICNTKCRICTSFASSQWVPEEIERDGDTNQLAKKMGRLGMWPEHNEKFWDELEHQIEEVESLEFFGGEPFLIKRHFEILEGLVEKGRAKDITLSYNSNGSIYPEHALPIWKEFKDVQVFFSIDGVGERFNYIRHPQDFDAVMENYWKFKQHDFIRTNLFYTVGIFNAFYMDELLEYDKEHNLDCDIHFNMVYVPEQVSAKALPLKAKQALTDKFKDNSDPRIQSTLNFINNEHYENMMELFVNHTVFSDKYRNESIAKTFPELYEHVKPWFEKKDAMELVNTMELIGIDKKDERL